MKVSCRTWNLLLVRLSRIYLSSALQGNQHLQCRADHRSQGTAVARPCLEEPPLLEAKGLSNTKPHVLGPGQLHNVWGPVRNENGGPFAQRAGGKCTFCLLLSLSQPVMLFLKFVI